MPEKAKGLPEAVVTGDCEPPDMVLGIELGSSARAVSDLTL